MLKCTLIDVKSSFTRILASSGYKEMFSSADIRQIANVIRRVVFLLFLLSF